MRTSVHVLVMVLVGACSGGSAAPDAPPACNLPLGFDLGDDGHAEPLAAGPAEARAGRIDAAELPAWPSGLAVWAPGDFVLANDRVAIVIEDAGPSDLYDPWGGRPVGIARIAGGALVEPADFGEILILQGRYSVVTTSVTVLNDGSDGQAAVVRAAGIPAPTPFFENIVGGLFREAYDDIPTAIDYVLEPGADYVDIFVVHNSPRLQDAEQPFTLHGFLFTPRMPLFGPRVGFGIDGGDYVGFIDDGATSFAYSRPGEPMEPGLSVSGFVSAIAGGFTLPACAQTRRLHARITIGGPGLDGLLQAVARADGEALRAISGTVLDASGAPAAGVRIHAEAEPTGAYLTHADTDAAGGYTLHVGPNDASVRLTAYRRGDSIVGPVVLADGASTHDFQLAPTGTIHVVAVDGAAGARLPVRVQVLPIGMSVVPALPAAFGDESVGGGRLHVDFAVGGESTLRVPTGEWEVVVSRGYEYELHREVVTVAAAATVEVAATLDHVVDTAGVMCGDYHIHTHRSNDSGDDAGDKVRSAVADGLEIPVRSEHEYVEDFQPLILELGLDGWAFGVASIEMTSMEIWGHMGVLPLDPSSPGVNGGAPLWQRYPDDANPAAPVETLQPPEVFAAVRARPEQPIIIINHPRGGANYFDYADYDRATGLPGYAEAWDEDFTLVEVFNDASWKQSGVVADWLSLLDHGRRVFAIGSSDSHGIRTSPVGYPRTCLAVGVDDPRQLTPELVRDVTGAGHSTISGGVYVDASVGAAGPGDDATGTGQVAAVRVRVQAASWVDVDSIDVVVDGQTVETIAILPGDADPMNPTVRFDREIMVDVSTSGSYVIVAAYGDSSLEPVHPGRIPFGVTNPIFLTR